MKVKDEAELANVLGMAFASYANRVQNGLVTPYLPFLKGVNRVTVDVVLNDDGSVTLATLDIDAIIEEEVGVQPEELFGEQEQTEAELVNSTPVLEATTKVIEEPYAGIPDSEFSSDNFSPAGIKETATKPKRKRKTA
jgi:hypothetical protein